VCACLRQIGWCARHVFVAMFPTGANARRFRDLPQWAGLPA